MKFSENAVFLMVATTLLSSISSSSAFVVVPGTRQLSTHAKKAAPKISGSNGEMMIPLTSITSMRRRSLFSLRAKQDDYDDDDEDEDAEPLSKGVESVEWLPTVIGATDEEISGAREDAEILPLFPLGGIVYTPNSEHVLNIFEPRYRQMYSDILMNGSKRFVVSMSHPTETGRFAKTGVLFELQELKEVSEQTADRVKYVCNHKVTGRVTMHRVLNPGAWESRDTYLRVEGTIHDDSGKVRETLPATPETDDVYGAVAAEAERNAARREEAALKEAFGSLVELQHDLEESVRFTKSSAGSLAVAPGPDGLWQTVRLWQSFAEQRLISRQADLQGDFQEKLREFLKKEKGLNQDELPGSIQFQDLSSALQEEVKELQKRMTVELKPLVLESTLTMQKILEAESHPSRCKLLRHFVNAERNRLSAKKTLQGMFSGDAAATDATTSSSIPPEEQLPSSTTSDDDGKNKKTTESTTDDSTSGSKSKSIFTDEPDAFQ